MRSFESLTEQEVLALAIALEEEDERVYSDFAENFRKDFPATASMFEGMRDEESTHRRKLIDLYRTKFGEHIPLIRRGDVKGLVTRRAIWLTQPLRPEAARRQASTLEVETRMFYEKAASRTQDASIRQLLNDLAQEEREHELRAEELGREKLDAGTRGEEDEASRRLFVLQIVQPGLAGLMDGRFQRWRRFLPPRLPGMSRTLPFWLDWRLHWARASAWVLLKRFQMMAALPAAGIRGCAGWFAA